LFQITGQNESESTLTLILKSNVAFSILSRAIGWNACTLYWRKWL